MIWVSLGDTKLGSRAKYLDPDPGDILMMKPPPSVALGRGEAQAGTSPRMLATNQENLRPTNF